MVTLHCALLSQLIKLNFCVVIFGRVLVCFLSFIQNAKMVMTSLSGHLMTLDFTASHQKWYASAQLHCVMHEHLLRTQPCFSIVVFFRYSCAPVALFSAPVAKYVAENYLPIKVSCVMISF